jgi:hypothetical protein
MNETFRDLTPQMLERLEKWRKNILPVKSAEVVRGKVKSYDEQEQELWEQEKKLYQERNKRHV